MWRLACLLAGLPLGALAALALAPGVSLPSLAMGALAGGVACLAGASLAARRHPGSGRRLAVAASVAWLALPAGIASWLGLRPGALLWLAALSVVTALALWRAARSPAPARGPAAALLAPVVSVALGSLGVLLLAGVLAVLGTRQPEFGERSANFVWDMDARIATAPLPRCAPRVASWRTLLERGSQPTLASDGEALWFEADGPDGRRQVHRLLRSSGEVACWTCDEPGNNRRPALSPEGTGLVFDSDRHVSPTEPTNTEVYLASGISQRPVRRARRLTRSPGPDDHAILAPGGFLLVWSRGEAGGFAVVSAPIQRGHGGLLLGEPGVLVPGGTSWVAPLAWSADAHALVVARGQPLAPASVQAVDFATGEEWSLGDDVLPQGAVGFSADGGWLVVAGARRAGALGRVPGFLGFALGRAVAATGRAGEFRAGEVRGGAAGAPPAAIALGDLGDWGAATGVSLEPDGRGFVLGQRNAAGEERLIEARFDCQEPGVAS